jgi:hypothetical protein
MSCYRLAKFYGCSPSEFLKQPISELASHIYWTNRLHAEGNPAEEE